MAEHKNIQDPELQGMIDAYKGTGKKEELPEELQTIVNAAHSKAPEAEVPEELLASIDAYKKMTAGQKRTLHN